MNHHLSRAALCLLLAPVSGARAAEKGFDKPGGYIFTVPANVFSLTLTVWGAGGAGGRGGGDSGGGGGGSGAVSRCFLATLPGQKYRLHVGEGGRMGARRGGEASSVRVLVAGSERLLVEATGGGWGGSAETGGSGGPGGESGACLASAQLLQASQGNAGGPGASGVRPGQIVKVKAETVPRGEGATPPALPRLTHEPPAGAGTGGHGGTGGELSFGAARARPRPGGTGGDGYVLVEW